MCCEAMPEGMATRRLSDPRSANDQLHRALHGFLMQMATCRLLGGGEHILRGGPARPVSARRYSGGYDHDSDRGRVLLTKSSFVDRRARPAAFAFYVIAIALFGFVLLGLVGTYVLQSLVQ